jgi:uncharacterized protein (TIGR02246 family)
MQRIANRPRLASAALAACSAGALLLTASCRSAAPAERESLGSVRLASACAAAAPASGAEAGPREAGPAAAAGEGGDASDAAVAAREICSTLGRAAANWNRGDLDAFLSDYLPGEQTTFIGRSGVLHGPEAIRSVYASRFAPGGVRDSLSFEHLEVDLLAPNLANAIAYYVLSRGDSTVARGPTSLVMRRVDGRWRIVHDHSS